MNRLQDKVALVTGAGGGIGRGIARALAAEGAAVVVNDLGTSVAGEGQSDQPAQQVVDEIVAAGGKAVANFGNVADYEQGTGIVQQAVEAFGRIDIVVNAAGILRDRMVFNMSEAEWDAVIAVHLKGTFNTVSAASKRFREQNSGRIINLSSSSAFGAPGQPNYAAAKAGILGFTWSCAYALRKNNVTANAILPTGATRMVDSMPFAQQMQRETGKLPSELAAGTEMDPANVAPLVVYLASDAAQNISGQCFGSLGYSLHLVSQPKIVKTLRAANGWTVDQLAEVMPRTFGRADIAIEPDRDLGIQVGLSTHRADLPDSAWVEVAPGIRFWSIPIPPDGEMR